MMLKRSITGIFVIPLLVSLLAAFLTTRSLIGFLLGVVVPDCANTTVMHPVQWAHFHLRFGVIYWLFIWTGLVFWGTLLRTWSTRLALVVSIIVTAAGLSLSVYLLRADLMAHAAVIRQITGLASADFALSGIHLEVVPGVGVVLILASYGLSRISTNRRTDSG
jgi:hypothetical protein